MSFLDPVFNPILTLNPLLAILIITFLISLFINLIYKYFTDQELLKSLKEKIKKHQGDMKKHRESPEKMVKIQKEAMQVNMKYMTHSMRSTLITFIPIILIFGWLNAHLAYDPIAFNEEFTITAEFEYNLTKATLETAPENEIIYLGAKTVLTEENRAVWTLKTPSEEKCRDPCTFTFTLKTNQSSYKKDFLASKTLYEPPVDQEQEGVLITVSNEKLRPLSTTKIPWVSTWGWLGTYIVFSLIFSISLKKLLKVY